MLTNDKHYWTKETKEDGSDSAFQICEILSAGAKKYGKEDKYISTKEYNCKDNWYDYHEDNSSTFRYLMLEVN